MRTRSARRQLVVSLSPHLTIASSSNSGVSYRRHSSCTVTSPIEPAMSKIWCLSSSALGLSRGGKRENATTPPGLTNWDACQSHDNADSRYHGASKNAMGKLVLIGSRL